MINHTNIKTNTAIFDVVFRRMEYWRKVLGNESRHKFVEDAFSFHCNLMGNSYPHLKQGEKDAINGGKK